MNRLVQGAAGLMGRSRSLPAPFRDGGRRDRGDFHTVGDDPLDQETYGVMYRPPQGPGGPERALMLAVLQEAVHTWHRYAGDPTPQARALQHEVEQWFRSPDTLWPFAFLPICETLGFDPDYLRAGVLRAHHARTSRRRAFQAPTR